MSKQLSSLIFEYAKTLPSWQKILAKLALDIIREVSDFEPEVEIACNRLKAEIKLGTQFTGDEIIKEIESISIEIDQTESTNIKLLEVNNYENVNALTTNQKILVAPKLTIIYGENASGKSGYSRILSSAFYSRGDKTILPNIMKPKPEQTDPKATFIFEINGHRTICNFPSDRSHPAFKQFACFDSKTVLVHLENSNELYVLPKEMQFFERLARLVAIVQEKLQREAEEKNKANPFLILFNEQSEIKKIIEDLNGRTDIRSIEKLIENEKELESNIQLQEKKYFELKLTDPKQKTTELNQIKEELEKIIGTFESILKSIYNNSTIDEINTAVQNLHTCLVDAQQNGIDTFKTSLLETTGSTQWKNFISSMETLARDESTRLKRKFPDQGDSCPLCLQLLSNNALELFERYFSFLKSETEKRLSLAKNKIEQLKSKNKLRLPNLQDYPKLQAWLENFQRERKKDIQDFISLLTNYVTSINLVLENSDLEKLPSVSETKIIQLLIELDNIIVCEIKKLDEENFTSELKKQESKLILLKHKRLLIDNVDKMKSHINDLAWYEKATTELAKISTRSITEKQKNIFEEYFNKQYKQRFYQEASHLKVNFQIEVKPKGTAGKTSRKLDILNYSPAEILSEGEQKVIALADFLTEIEICNIRGGIVFDDPVNSLDHERKKYISKRLVAESSKRQVIIFTHDIGFLYDLINEADAQSFKENQDVYYHWVSKIGDDIGIITPNQRKELEADYKEPKNAEKNLLEAKKIICPQERERKVREGFDNLRQTYEAFILYELFAGTVVRFDRQLKYGQFKEVYVPREYIDAVSEKLSYCSGLIQGHLASDHYTGERPSPELLEKEIEAFKTLKKKFRDERKNTITKH